MSNIPILIALLKSANTSRFCVWACMCGGVGVTGRAVYFTMALPIVMTIIILGRSVSLPNAVDGIRLYFATWNGDQLGRGQIWQTACGQVFFSTGVGFGYYISYASYNQKYANAVQDAFILVCSNCLFETVAAFAVFGVVGYLGISPSNTPRKLHINHVLQHHSVVLQHADKRVKVSEPSKSVS